MQLLELLKGQTKGIYFVVLGADSEEEQDDFQINPWLKGKLTQTLFDDSKSKFQSLQLENGAFKINENELLDFVDFLKREKSIFISTKDRDVAFHISNGHAVPPLGEI